MGFLKLPCHLATRSLRLRFSLFDGTSPGLVLSSGNRPSNKTATAPPTPGSKRRKLADDPKGSSQEKEEEEGAEEEEWNGWACVGHFDHFRVWNVDNEHRGARSNVKQVLRSQFALAQALHTSPQPE